MIQAPVRELRRLAGVLAVMACIGAGVSALGLRWQHTGSLPRGLYRVARGAPVQRGSVLLWCLDSVRGRWARERGYVTRGRCPGDVEPLGKVVLGVPGDTIEWLVDGVRLNGRSVPATAALRRDRVGRPLPIAPHGRYVLTAGEVWLYSPYSTRSLDSRYFGPTSVAATIGVVVPFLVVGR